MISFGQPPIIGKNVVLLGTSTFRRRGGGGGMYFDPQHPIHASCCRTLLHILHTQPAVCIRKKREAKQLKHHLNLVSTLTKYMMNTTLTSSTKMTKAGCWSTPRSFIMEYSTISVAIIAKNRGSHVHMYTLAASALEPKTAHRPAAPAMIAITPVLVVILRTHWMSLLILRSFTE